MSDDLKDIVAGDEVCWTGGYLSEQKMLIKVERVTNTLIVTYSGSKWNRKTGKAVPRETGWGRSSIRIVTQRDRDDIEREEHYKFMKQIFLPQIKIMKVERLREIRSMIPVAKKD